MIKTVKSIIIIFGLICSCKSPESPSSSQAKIISFVANQSEVAIGGSVNLTWVTENATRCEISGIGQVPVNGTLSFILQDSTTFVLTATGKNNDTQKAYVYVDVNKDDPCKYLTITVYRGYATYYHVETSVNQSKYYDMKNVEITVIIFDKNNNVIDSGVGIISIIPKGSAGQVDVILQFGRGSFADHTSVAITKCSSF